MFHNKLHLWNDGYTFSLLNILESYYICIKLSTTGAFKVIFHTKRQKEPYCS